MAPPLGPADSFNSSSATIRPDDNQRSRLPPAGGGLGPADSVGRDFNSIRQGNVGLLQSTGNPMMDSYLQSYRPEQFSNGNNATAGSSNSAPLGRMPSEFNSLAFLNDPTGGTGGTFFDGLCLDPSSSNSRPAFTFPQPATENNTNEGELFRPSSSHSHRSTHSHHSLSTTDVDTDSGFYTTDLETDDQESSVGPSPGPNPVAEIGGLNLNTASPAAATGPSWATASPAPVATISPDDEGLGGRRMSTTKRARTATAPAGDDEQRRQDRLEHRRSINRRSAQKHRLRRKEELETLSRQLAERDARIAQLERDLAVARAQNNQIYALMGPQLAAAAAAAGAAPTNSAT